MTDLEKVIRGLECCHTGENVPRCNECPYVCTNVLCRKNDIYADAYVLLKAQEPRLMTVEEAANQPEGTVIWVEQHTEDRDFLYAMVSSGNGKIGNFSLGMRLEEIGTKNIRFWTSKPTDEQRKEE